mgnify:CR=1 FL=1
MSDGAKLYDDIHSTIRTYCVLPGDHETVAVVLWVVLTHILDRFDYAPRLVIRSPTKRSGKTRLLDMLDGLAYRPLKTANCSTAYLYRSLGADPPPTLLFDEVDSIFGTAKAAEQNEDLRGLLNAGFSRGTTVGRCVGPHQTPEDFETFACAALAGIGRLPDTIEDRAVVVTMKRRTPEERVKPFRLRRDRPVLDALRERITQFVTTIPQDTNFYPTNIGVDDRAADVWEPLIAVADLAGTEWGAKARKAARALVACGPSRPGR